MGRKLVWPDYENCIANLPNSVLKAFGVRPVGASLPLMDGLLQTPHRNTIVLLLDGMGMSILERCLPRSGLFRSHLAGTYRSVFLSTTVAATTSVLSGLQPCEHSWLGWDCYYPQLGKNVTVFLNTLQGTEEQAAPFNVAGTFTPYESVPEKIRKNGGDARVIAPFLPPRPRSIEELCACIRKACAEPGRKYIYAYCDQPDGLLHREGCGSETVRGALAHIEAVIGAMAEELEDALLVITADHGHIDTEYAVLQDYPRICDCLVRLPSLEPRVLNLFVKEGKTEQLENEFRKEFGSRFLLMPTEEALEKNLFGTGRRHPLFRSMLGDRLAIATDNLSIYFNQERWRSMHGSVTEEEMMIPLIALER